MTQHEDQTQPVHIPLLTPARPRPCCCCCCLQVDDRLNGDGVGYPLGISDPALGWVFVGVASLLWILYFIAQKDFGDFEDKDSGVGL